MRTLMSALIVLVVASIVATAQTETQTGTLPVYRADGWRVFCTGLTLFPESFAVSQLTGQFSVSRDEARLVTVSCGTFLGTLNLVDVELRREISRVYRSPLPPSPQRRLPDLPEFDPIMLPPGVSSLREELVRTGRLAEYEARRDAVVAALVDELQRLVPPPTVDAIERHVREDLTSRIIRTDAPRPQLPTMLRRTAPERQAALESSSDLTFAPEVAVDVVPGRSTVDWLQPGPPFSRPIPVPPGIVGNPWPGSFENGVLRLEVDQIDPLPHALGELARLTGIPIHREEPPWAYPGDLTIVQLPRGGQQLGRPKRAVLRLEHALDTSTPDVTTLDTVAMLVEDLLLQYERQGSSARFRVERSGNALQVIPVSMKNAHGIEVPVVPLLDTPIVVPEAERALGEWFAVIASALGEAGGTPVVPIVMGNAFIRNRATLSAHHEPARAVLLRLLEAAPGMYWSISYDPHQRRYLLSSRSTWVNRKRL